MTPPPHDAAAPDSPVAPVIDVDGVTFAYGSEDGAARAGVPSLNDVTFEAPPGTLTLLCGASGSGKSSALRLLNGLIPHFHTGTLTGKVHVSGVDVPATDISEAGRTTSTVFQNPRTQFFTSDVISELAFRGENYGLPPDLILERARGAAEQVGISDLLDRHLTQLSGGELQKVACAQAIAGDTPVLLFDEPTSNLSPTAIEEFAGLLARLRAQGHTIVVAEHRLYFLAGLADQVQLLDGGRIAARFESEEFFDMGEERRRALGLRCLHAPTVQAGAPEDGVAGDRDTSGVSLDHVRFSYGARRVLDIDQLDFPAGRVSALVGDNGVGKSTLARVVCGLATPERGSVVALDGRNVDSRQRVAASYIVMQDVHRQLFAEDVRSEVTLGLGRKERAGVDANALLEQFDLADLADRHPLSLSGGQKQRLVIASAIACRKRVYVFDEPTSGVDARHLNGIAAQLRALARGGAVVIVITHDVELLDACADRIVVLDPAEEMAQGGSQTRVRLVRAHPTDAVIPSAPAPAIE